MKNETKYEYSITRADDRYNIRSRDIIINDVGIWINDDLESGRKDCSIFLPFHNIFQINRYEITIVEPIL